MNKISPLRAGLDAINKFRTNKLSGAKQDNGAATNPFGITFKGSMLQMDVFESSSKDKAKGNPLKEGFTNLASSVKNWGANVKNNAVSFYGNVKNNVVNFGNSVKDSFGKLASTELSLDLFGNSVSKLEKKSTNELENMFKSELTRV